MPVPAPHGLHWQRREYASLQLLTGIHIKNIQVWNVVGRPVPHILPLASSSRAAVHSSSYHSLPMSLVSGPRRNW